MRGAITARWLCVCLLGTGCDKVSRSLSIETKTETGGPNITATCAGLLSETAGLDKEIEERISSLYDIKWRLQAFGSIGKELYARMLDQEERLIRARSKREELYSRGGYAGCDVHDDTSDCSETGFFACVRGVRDGTKPDGYNLDDRGCKAIQVQGGFYDACLKKHSNRDDQVWAEQRARKQRAP